MNEINASHEIQMILREMLSSALELTPAQTGLIGLIDEDFKNISSVWFSQPRSSEIEPIDKIDLDLIPEVRKDTLAPLIIEDSTLSSTLHLPENYVWHFIRLTEVAQEHYVLLLLHLKSPQEFSDKDIQTLSKLNDQNLDKLDQAFLYEDLQDAIQAKNEFISFISHELKNPLSVINSYADMMRKGMTGNVTTQQKEYLATIIQNVKRMDKFIEDLSDQSHIETQTLQLVFESTSAKQVILEVLQSYKAQITDKAVILVKRIADDMPDMWCDRIRVIQILSNLLSNAIKYTPKDGSVEIGAKHSQNKWDQYGPAEVIHFWVKDTGYGISVNEQSRIFDRFFRASDERIQKAAGVGLGLLIAKSLSEMMGGKMWFESALNKGSTFHFTVPILRSIKNSFIKRTPVLLIRFYVKSPEFSKPSPRGR